jgi:hypothetical protein
MDFRGPLVGDFLYHCHILDHEDNGMMAIIRVLPRGQKITSSSFHVEAPTLLANSVAWCRRRK